VKRPAEKAKDSTVISITGQILLGLSTILLVIYFLGVSQPGRATVAWVVEGEIHGTADVGNVFLDPLSAAVTMTDLAIRDDQDRPVASVRSLQVIPEGVSPPLFKFLHLDGMKFSIYLDQDGRFSLESLFRDKEKKGNRRPKPLLLDRLLIGDSEVRLDTPFGSIEAGLVEVNAHVEAEPDQFPSGQGEAEIGRFILAPRDELVGVILEGLLGSAGPYSFGPLLAQASFGNDQVHIPELSLTFPAANLRIQGRLNPLLLEGRLALSVTSDGQDIASLLAERSADSWLFSTLVTQLTIPGLDDETWMVPQLELNGLSVNALPKTITCKLNRLSSPDVKLGELHLEETSLSANLHYEGSEPVDSYIAAVLGQDFPVDRFLAQWRKGKLSLSLLVSRIVLEKALVAAPLRVRLEALRTDDHKVHLTLSTTLHPHGSITAELRADLNTADGKTPFVATVTVKGLETETLVAAAGLPGFVRGMVTGRLDGRLEVVGHELAAGIVKVNHCRFDLTRKEGGNMVFRTPDDNQNWDFTKEPGFSLFTKEVKFGEGRLIMEVAPVKN
jgi:hypothetical protein